VCSFSVCCDDHKFGVWTNRLFFIWVSALLWVIKDGECDRRDTESDVSCFAKLRERNSVTERWFDGEDWGRYKDGDKYRLSAPYVLLEWQGLHAWETPWGAQPCVHHPNQTQCSQTVPSTKMVPFTIQPPQAAQKVFETQLLFHSLFDTECEHGASCVGWDLKDMVGCTHLSHSLPYTHKYTWHVFYEVMNSTLRFVQTAVHSLCIPFWCKLKPLLHCLFKAGMSRCYSTSPFFIKGMIRAWWGQSGVALKLAVEVVAALIRRLCKCDSW